jgi:hypothetical protein
MTDRLRMLWPAGLVALGGVCAGLGAGLELQSALLFHEADEFYRSLTGSDPNTVESSQYYDTLWLRSAVLHQVVSPLIAGGVLAVLALLATLALRWERRA